MTKDTLVSMPHYTHHKHKGAPNYVCVDVLYKSGLLTECLITYFTGLGVISTMYALMCSQGSLTTECLITHIANIRALTTM